MKLTIISKNQVSSKYNNVLKDEVILDDDSDIVIVYSDDYFDDTIFSKLLRLKKKYLGLFVTSLSTSYVQMYNKQYLEFCFDNNINFLDFDNSAHKLDDYIEKNIRLDNNYTKFAKYYLTLQPQVDYDIWLSDFDFSDKDVVDLGCGVPDYVQVINPRSYIGYDLSQTMISKAQKKYEHYRFINENITNVRERCDVVLSIFDVLNYLQTIEDVYRVFENVYQNLNDGGVFIFDVHKKTVLTLFENHFDYVDNADEQFIWQADTKGNEIIHYLEIIDSEYIVHIEKHKQTYYDIELLLKKLKNIGFIIKHHNECYEHHIIMAKKEVNNEKTTIN